MDVHIIGIDQCKNLFVYLILQGGDDIVHILGIVGYGSDNQTGNFQRILQFTDIQSIPLPPIVVPHPKENHQQNDACHHYDQENRQSIRLTFQHQVSAFQLLVLTSIIQDIQINVPVIVRFGFHTQGCICNTQLFAETSNPFRYGLDSVIIYPLEFNGSSSHRNKRFQTVGGIGTMIIAFMMFVYKRQCTGETIQGLLMLSLFIETRSQCTIGTGYLIRISI